MKRSNLIIFILISVIFTLVVSIVYFLNISGIIDKKAKGRVYDEVSETITYFNSYSKRFYDDIEEYLNHHEGEDKDQIITNLASTYDYENNGILFFGYFTKNIDGEYEFGNIKAPHDKEEEIYESVVGLRSGFLREDDGRFLGNDTESKKISIARLNYIFRSGTLEYNIVFYHLGDFYIVQDFSRFDTMMTSVYEKGTFRYVVCSSRDGWFYVNTYNGNTTLQGFFSQDIPEDLVTFLNEFNEKDPETHIQVVTMPDTVKNYLVTTKPMLGDYNEEGIYILALVEATFLNSFTSSMLISTLIYIAFFVVLILIITIGLYIMRMNVKDLVIPLSNDNFHLLIVSKEGKVLAKNQRFKNSIFDCQNLVKCNILESDTVTKEIIQGVLENSSTITLRKAPDGSDKDQYIRFVIVKALNRYELIGYDGEERPENINRLSALGVNIDNAFQDDVYTTALNRKALFSRISELCIDGEKRIKDYYLFYAGIKNRPEIVKLYGSRTNEKINETLINIIKEHINGNEVYCVNGEFFAFFLKLKDNFNDLKKHVDEINVITKKPFSVYSDNIMADVRFGVYPFSLYDSLSGIFPKTILDKAIIAYEKAIEGKDSVYYLFDNNSESILAKDLQIADDLRKAIDEDEFVTFYQPVYNLYEDRVSGFECLLRWNNPKYQYESPFEYIKVAERSGFIQDIGLLTFRKTFELIKELGRDDIRISVNVSPAQMLQPGFTNSFVKLYEEYGVDYSQVAIEITETFLIESMSEVVDILTYIRSFGIKVYLDDFGTGYSSLQYLAELPIDVLKIDLGFTRQIKTNQGIRTIISHIIGIANELELSVVAEGVEDDMQLDFLEQKRCKYIQGYYFSKPVPYDKVREALKIKRRGKK
ncbi:EAL domain-containing protein [bacterium]|nr:EAL domain-containing protein [bacterium]